MQLKIHAIHFDADQKLEDFIQEKMDKIEQYDESIMGGEVFLRLNNSDADSKRVEARLDVPGTDIFAKKDADSFEEATDKVQEALVKQVKKHKEKTREHK